LERGIGIENGVHTGSGKPGKSWNFIVVFPGLESPGKLWKTVKFK